MRHACINACFVLMMIRTWCIVSWRDTCVVCGWVGAPVSLDNRVERVCVFVCASHHYSPLHPLSCVPQPYIGVSETPANKLIDR